jgi:hypothetical protein
MSYQPFPIHDMISQAKQDGVDFKDLIEPVILFFLID